MPKVGLVSKQVLRILELCQIKLNQIKPNQIDSVSVHLCPRKDYLGLILDLRESINPPMWHMKQGENEAGVSQASVASKQEKVSAFMSRVRARSEAKFQTGNRSERVIWNLEPRENPQIPVRGAKLVGAGRGLLMWTIYDGLVNWSSDNKGA